MLGRRGWGRTAGHRSWLAGQGFPHRYRRLHLLRFTVHAGVTGEGTLPAAGRAAARWGRDLLLVLLVLDRLVVHRGPFGVPADREVAQRGQALRDTVDRRRGHHEQ